MRPLLLAVVVVLAGASAWQIGAPATARAYDLETPRGSLPTAALLDSLQRTGFLYFWEQANPVNGLIRDRSQSWSPCSIAAQGFGITAICIGIDHGWVSREEGRARIMLGMQTLWNGAQGDATFGVNGYRGLFYHFLDINSGNRTWSCELSTIDTALLMAGVLDAREYFDTSDPGDVALRALADSLYQRVDWDFMRSGGGAIKMGWKPDTGFNTFGYWIGYNEAMILYVLALGSPTHPVPASAWAWWTTGYQWRTQYGQSYVSFPPLFGHQYSHCWIDYRYIWDDYMRSRGITYFENSRRATLAQQAYCIANPGGWAGYGAECWGLTASDDPDGYVAHGAPPPQNDNGTITPTAAASSLPFAPEIVVPTLHHLYDTYGSAIWGRYGFKDAFNLTRFWFGGDVIGIDQGPIVIMIENYLNGAVWERCGRSPYLVTGLERAGFASVTPVAPLEEATAPVAIERTYPNPTSGVTSVQFRLAQAGDVTLEMFDVRGRCVREIKHTQADKGLGSLTVDAAELPSGVYLFSIEAGGHRAWQRCLVVQ